MRRLAAVLAGALLIATSSRATLLHVHEAAEHANGEHEHGPAAHEHHAPPAVHRDHDGEHANVPSLEACDPGDHVVTVSFLGSPATEIRVDRDLDAASPVVPTSAPADASSEVTDIRVHGPPDSGASSPRAPPLRTPDLIS